ncbi:MAG: hydrogenase maturation protease [Bacteroidales bacterium]
MEKVPSYFNCEVLVLGCGNILFGDDGFGPMVADELLKNYDLPENACIINAGSSVRNILFDITLSEKRPGKIIIVDAIDVGRAPGEIFELPIDQIPERKIDDFSMHQLPTSNLLKELKEFCKVDIVVVACQTGKITEEVTVKVSPKITKAIKEACKRIVEIINN